MASGRDAVDSRKAELRRLVESWFAEQETPAVVLAALGETTAEATISLYGRPMAKEMMLELAKAVQAGE